MADTATTTSLSSADVSAILTAVATIGLVLVGALQALILKRTDKAASTNTKIAQQTAQTLKAVERGYVYPEIVSQTASDWVRGEADIPFERRPLPTVTFALRNFGKTPARITRVEADLSFFQLHEPRVRRSALQVPSTAVLGANEATEHLTARASDLSMADANAIASGAAEFLLNGFVNFLDVWDEEQGSVFVWKYIPSAGRFIPIQQPTKPLPD